MDSNERNRRHDANGFQHPLESIAQNGSRHSNFKYGVLNSNFVGESETSIDLNNSYLVQENGGISDLANGINSQTKNSDAAGNGKSVEKTENGIEDETDFRSLVPFCILYGIGSLVSQSLTVYLSSQITVLEKAFGLSSFESGILLSANDVGFVITVLLASHFLKNYHIPRILSVCILMFGISGLLTSLPNFLTSNGNVATPRNGSVAQAQNRLCLLERHDNTTFTEKCALESASEMSRDRDSQWVVIFISCMMLIQGVAKAPRSALSSLYIDNNSPKIKTGFYIGILMSFSIFGPVIAVVLGGVFNKMPVDLKETSMSPSDPRWIGAWWLGFILFGALSCLISIPIFFFPASLRKNGNQASNVYANSEILEQKTLVQPIKDLPRSLGRVLKRPVYTCTMISVLFYLFGIMAMGSFGPKYIENQFHVPTWKANWVMGIEKLAPTVIGTFVGGVITRRLRLGLTGSVKMVFIIRIVVFALSCLNFMFGCPNPNVIIGMPTEVSSIANTFHSGTNISLIASTTCACSDVTYLPVCADDQTWFSPCHAGCQTEKQRMYYNCTATLGGTASPGMCTKGCDMLIPFVAVNALASFIGTLGLSPNYIVLLRSVGVNDRSMGVALMSFLMALLVFMPAPIVFGKVFDAFCLVWKNKCSGRGSCLLYDVIDLRFHLVGINVALAFISVVLVGISVLFALRLKDPDADDVGDKKLSMKPPIPQPRTSLTSQKGDGDGNVDRSDKR